MIALIDYLAANLTSVRKALAEVGADVYTPESAAGLVDAAGIIVPGVGHFTRAELGELNRLLVKARTPSQ